MAWSYLIDFYVATFAWYSEYILEYNINDNMTITIDKLATNIPLDLISKWYP